jgi:hypothetical protein
METGLRYNRRFLKTYPQSVEKGAIIARSGVEWSPHHDTGGTGRWEGRLYSFFI